MEGHTHVKNTLTIFGIVAAWTALWLFVFGCAFNPKHAVRSAYDLGVKACELWAEGQPEGSLGVEIEVYCAVAAHAQPFVDHLLAMQRLPARGLPNVLAEPARACFVAPEISSPESTPAK